jgi:hypothetical protein
VRALVSVLSLPAVFKSSGSIYIFLTQKGFVPILKQMPMAPVTAIKAHRITG